MQTTTPLVADEMQNLDTFLLDFDTLLAMLFCARIRCLENGPTTLIMQLWRLCSHFNNQYVQLACVQLCRSFEKAILEYMHARFS